MSYGYLWFTMGGKYVLKSAICSYMAYFFNLGFGKKTQFSAAHNRPLPKYYTYTHYIKYNILCMIYVYYFQICVLMYIASLIYVIS